MAGRRPRRGWRKPSSTKQTAAGCTPRSSATRSTAAGQSRRPRCESPARRTAARPGSARWAVRDDELLSQRGADLGERERAAFVDLFAAGFRKVVMVGSDLPTLPADHIRQALEQVAPGTAVLGPSEDGGYYLLALAAPATDAALPDLFSGIRWSTAAALEDTLAAARRAGLRVALVPRWRDVDDAAGLARLRDDLEAPAGRARAPETARVLDELFS